MKRLLVQILVVVAHIQMRTLKTEVEKGSLTQAIDAGKHENSTDLPERLRKQVGMPTDTS